MSGTPDAPRRPCVLVVDDDAQMRMLIRAVLEEAGYRVVLAAHAREARSALEADAPGLVITDLVMPEEGGPSLIEHLRRSRADLPVIAVSGRLGGSADLTGVDVGTVLRKPFDIDELITLVRQALPG